MVKPIFLTASTHASELEANNNWSSPWKKNRYVKP